MKFSIVMPSFNQGQYIRQSIDSVLNQNYKNFEFIVCDGGSTDDTVEILKSYGDRIHWVSEKDSGYADAVNKGFAKASGNYGLWLASDDLYFDSNALTQIANHIQKTSADVVYGDSFYFDDDGKQLGAYPTKDFDLDELKTHFFICQPSTAFRISKFREVGGLDLSLKSVADYDLWLRMAFHGSKFSHLSSPISLYRLQKNSITVSQRLFSFLEIFEVQKKYFKKVAPKIVLDAIMQMLIGSSSATPTGHSTSAPSSKSLKQSIKQALVKVKRTLLNPNVHAFWLGQTWVQNLILKKMRGQLGQKS